MSFIVTARKWRPVRFDDVIGQEHITTTLKNAIKNKRIAHAFIFAGPRGVGKTTTARILAKSLNCLSPVDAEPCNECDMCRSFDSSQSLDIIEIDGASNRRIDEIRTLRESVKYAPTKGNYKVYIIDEVHMLTTESFNALLKTLEEPPEHTIFIFATTDVHKVPLTIISRCQRFDFRRIEMNPIKNLLKKIAEEEKIEIDDQSLTIIAKKADGALRDAESLFDQIVSFSEGKIEAAMLSGMLNLIDDEVYFAISDSVLVKNYLTAFEVTKQVFDKGWNFVDFTNGLIEHFRNILTVVVTGKTELIESAEVYKEKYFAYRGKYSESDLLRILGFLNKTAQELRYAANQRLKIEVALSHLIGLEKSISIKEALEKLDELKKRTSGFEAREPKANAYSAPSFFPNEENIEKPNNVTKSVVQNFNKETFSSQNYSANDLTLKWKSFINTVNQEKLVVGSALSNLKFLGAEGNELKVVSGDQSIKNILEQNKKYLDGKVSDFFGASYQINHQTNSDSLLLQTHDSGSHNNINNGSGSSGVNNSELINAIINELGGEELE